MNKLHLIFLILSVIHCHKCILVFDYNYKSCSLIKLTTVEHKKHKIEVPEEFRFENLLYTATSSTDEKIFYKLCGHLDQTNTKCPGNSSACLFNNKASKTINFGTEFRFDNTTTDKKLVSINGQKCSTSQNYSLTIRLHCPSQYVIQSSIFNQTEPCKYESVILDPNCNLPCTARIDGKILDLSPLKKSYCLDVGKNQSYCLSLCDVDRNCSHTPLRKTRLKINRTDLNACEIKDNVTNPIALASTLQASYNGDKNLLVFRGSLHEEGKTKSINHLSVNLKCNWNKKNSENLDLQYIKKPTQGKNYDFELETIYGCVKKSLSCEFTEKDLIYNLTGLHLASNKRWTVGNISHEMFLNICGTLDLPSEFKNCSETYSQVCEKINGKVINRGSILRSLELKDDVIFANIENGNQCEENPHVQYATFIEFHCNEMEEGPNFIHTNQSCATHIVWRTPHACPSFNVSYCHSTSSNTSVGKFTKNGSLINFESLNQQKTFRNGTSEFYISIFDSVNIEDGPCLNDVHVLLVNRSVFNKKHRYFSLGKFPESQIVDDDIVFKYSGGYYCGEGQDYMAAIKFLCSETEEEPFLVNQTKCSFEFNWRSPHGCARNITTSLKNCSFKDNQLTYNFSSIETRMQVKNENITYTFEICHKNYTICDKNDCISELLQTPPSLAKDENGTSVQMHLPKSCDRSIDFNVVNFVLMCDRVKNNHHIQSYSIHSCVLEVKYMTDVVCPPEDNKAQFAVENLYDDQSSSSVEKIVIGVSGGILLLVVISVLSLLLHRRRMQYKTLSTNTIYVRDTEL